MTEPGDAACGLYPAGRAPRVTWPRRERSERGLCHPTKGEGGRRRRGGGGGGGGGGRRDAATAAAAGVGYTAVLITLSCGPLGAIATETTRRRALRRRRLVYSSVRIIASARSLAHLVLQLRRAVATRRTCPCGKRRGGLARGAAACYRREVRQQPAQSAGPSAAAAPT